MDLYSEYTPILWIYKWGTSDRINVAFVTISWFNSEHMEKCATGGGCDNSTRKAKILLDFLSC